MLFIIISHSGVILNIIGILLVIFFKTPRKGYKLSVNMDEETEIKKQEQKDRIFATLGIFLFFLGVLFELSAYFFFYDI